MVLKLIASKYLDAWAEQSGHGKLRQIILIFCNNWSLIAGNRSALIFCAIVCRKIHVGSPHFIFFLGGSGGGCVTVDTADVLRTIGFIIGIIFILLFGRAFDRGLENIIGIL
jgi:hypothetical protein